MTLRAVFLMPGELQFCAGCPHRATFWSIKDALKLDGRGGIVAGDIGCYAMGQGATGYSQTKTCHAMGFGVGLASGLGKLGQFGFTQPVLTVCGDSTFFHASIPALINSVHNGSAFISCSSIIPARDDRFSAPSGHRQERRGRLRPRCGCRKTL